jgi:small-conductance mechanosensitive channel
MEDIIDLFNNDQWLWLVILGTLFITFIVHFWGYKVGCRWIAKTDNHHIKILFTKARDPSLIVLWLIELNIFRGSYLETKSDKIWIDHLIYILTVTMVSWLLIAIVLAAKRMILSKYDIKQKDNLRARKLHTQLNVLKNIIVTIIVILGVGIALMTFDQVKQLGTSILASAGVAGIIIGFAAQKSIATVLAGFQIAMTQPIRIDDVVIVENEWGRIEEITLTYVVVLIWDQRRLIIPITYFIEKPFQNWTRENSMIWGTVFIYTDYTMPVQALREELTRLVKGTDLWDGKINVLQVTNATESAMEIRALVSAVDSPTAWDLRVYLREKLIEFIQKEYPESLPKSRVIIKQSDLTNSATGANNKSQVT